ncbi:MAG: MFS transporter [Candidatus Cloacimonas sp.]
MSKIDKQRKQSQLRTSFQTSITEGIFAQIYGNLSAIGSSFIVKLMVLLDASPMHYSLLSAIGQVSAIWQPLGVAITYKLRQQKNACVLITAVGRALTMFLGLSLLFHNRLQGIWFALLLLFFSAGLQAMSANIWIAWISDLIPLSLRGRFFSKRNQILVGIGLIVSYLVSFHIDLFESTRGAIKLAYLHFLRAEHFFVPQNQPWFLAGIYVFASLIGLIGLLFLRRQPENPLSSLSEERLRDRYLSPFKDKNFRLLLIFGIWWMLAIGVGSPFWGPFMMKNLSMSMFKIQIYNTLSVLSSILSYQFWGRFIDKNGNKTAMKICIVLGGLNPMLWLFTSAKNFSILWLEALISGFMWAGAGIITTNFVLSIAIKGREQVYSGVYGAITGLAMMVSTLACGIFFPSALTIGKKYIEPEQVIFVLGGLMRWLSFIPLYFVVEKQNIPLHKALLSLFKPPSKKR